MNPNPILILLIVFALVAKNGPAQEKVLFIETSRNEDQTVDFNYRKEAHGSYYVMVNFTHLDNAWEEPIRKVVKFGIGKLFTLRPVSPDKGIAFSYSYQYIRGVPNPKIDSTLVYLLPFSHGKSLRVSHHFNIYEKYFGDTQPKNWKSFQFEAEPGDTVFSARRGLVVEVVDEYEPDTTHVYSYTPKANSIMIEHPDGTLARYSVLQRGTIMVKPGQQVMAHQPLALAGTFDKPENTQLRFFIEYLCDEKLDDREPVGKAKRKHFYAFVDPLFCTQSGNIKLGNHTKVVSNIADQYIFQELTKRELKKMKK